MHACAGARAGHCLLAVPAVGRPPSATSSVAGSNARGAGRVTPRPARRPRGRATPRPRPTLQLHIRWPRPQLHLPVSCRCAQAAARQPYGPQQHLSAGRHTVVWPAPPPSPPPPPPCTSQSRRPPSASKLCCLPPGAPSPLKTALQHLSSPPPPPRAANRPGTTPPTRRTMPTCGPPQPTRCSCEPS